VNRISSDTRRARFTPEEIISLTLDFYRRNYIEGLFLSSGIIQSPDYTMEQLVAVARGLRIDHKFNGYIHLKAIPGASPEIMHEAGCWADRLSANVELPTQDDLTKLAPEKQLVTIRTTMSGIFSDVERAKEESRAAARIVSRPGAAPKRVSTKRSKFAPAGQSTQMVVGATDTNDATILNLASDLYGTHGLRRIYYSAFSPFPKADSRLPIQAPPLVREHRLYEADWLMRYYGFSAGELTTASHPNLDLRVDPKLNWALRNREKFPIDINRGTREELLRIPGIGYRTVSRILSIRKYHRMRLEDLKKLRVFLRRAKAFVTTSDFSPVVAELDSVGLETGFVSAPVQMSLFEAQVAAVNGEL
jgi:putative DNA modification/repair radical SAM protein